MNENNKASTGKMAKVAAQKQAAAGKLRQRGRRKEQGEDKLDPQKDKYSIKKSLRALQEKTLAVCPRCKTIPEDQSKKNCPKCGNELVAQKMAVPDEDAAPVNEEGFKEIWSIIDPAINRSTSYSYLNSNDELHAGTALIHTVWLKLMQHYDDFGIESTDDCKVVADAADKNFKFAISKARKGRGLENDEKITEVRRVEDKTDDSANNESNNPLNLFS